MKTRAGITENVSENRKRGRPRVLSVVDVTRSALYFPEVTTARGKQNLFYQQRAVCVLVDDPRFYWIMGGSEKEITSGRGTMRRSILPMPGRIQDDNELKSVADEICRVKPTARHAAEIVRNYLGVKRSPDVPALVNRIIGNINDYIRRYPDTTTEQLQSALWTALSMVGKRSKEPKP